MAEKFLMLADIRPSANILPGHPCPRYTRALDQPLARVPLIGRLVASSTEAKAAVKMIAAILPPSSRMAKSIHTSCSLHAISVRRRRLQDNKHCQ